MWVSPEPAVLPLGPPAAGARERARRRGPVCVIYLKVQRQLDRSSAQGSGDYNNRIRGLQFLKIYIYFPLALFTDVEVKLHRL